MREACDGCGDRVSIGGSTVNLWDFEQDRTGGMTLELADGSEFFLCYDCIDRLPDDVEVTAEHVAQLSE